MVLPPHAPLASFPRLSLPTNGSFYSQAASPLLRRLLYTSRATHPERCDAAFLRDLAELAQTRNRQVNITGFLVYSAPFFFQVIEGPPASISGLFCNILGDNRHVDRVIILDMPCSERLYADWAMKVSDAQSIALHPTIATVLSCLASSFISMWPYLPGNAAHLLVEGKNPICEAPEHLQVVTAFIHIVDFPAILQQTVLNNFLPDILELFVDACTRYIGDSGGKIAKFVNGTCMAFWPADSAWEAITAVQNIAARLRASRETEPSWSPLSLLHISAGLHFGGALLCHAGQRKSDFTLLGDSINTTARIASLALKLRRSLLLSATVATLLVDKATLHSTGLHTLRGREGTVECFHFNEPEIPVSPILRGTYPSTSLCQYQPRRQVKKYDDLLDDAPTLFQEFKVSPLKDLTPRSSYFLGRATWALRTAPNQESLMALTYISRTAGALSYHDISIIQEQGTRGNQQGGITSCLLQLNDALMQTLEGPPSTLLSVWRRIKSDPRHNDVVAVHMATLTHRQYKEPLQVLRITDDMMAGFPALPDILTQLARSFLCLEMYVPSVVVRHIAAGQDPRSLQPVSVSVAMLAADICSFTSLSEGCALRGVWHLCNSFIEGCTTSIVANGGEVIKLIGDCVTAYFPTSSLRAAVTAAEAIMCHCEKVRRKHSAERCDTRAMMWAGVGLDWGPVVIAPCGSLGVADLMVTGEVSSRVMAIEEATREVGCAIVTSDAFAAHVVDKEDVLERLSHEINGMPLYRRRGPQWDLDPTDIKRHIRLLRPHFAALQSFTSSNMSSPQQMPAAVPFEGPLHPDEDPPSPLAPSNGGAMFSCPTTSMDRLPRPGRRPGRCAWHALCLFCAPCHSPSRRGVGTPPNQSSTDSSQPKSGRLLKLLAA